MPPLHGFLEVYPEIVKHPQKYTGIAQLHPWPFIILDKVWDLSEACGLADWNCCPRSRSLCSPTIQTTFLNEA